MFRPSGASADSIPNRMFSSARAAQELFDGKLTTGIKDPLCRFVIDELANHGAPEEIRWSQSRISAPTALPRLSAISEKR